MNQWVSDWVSEWVHCRCLNLIVNNLQTTEEAKNIENKEKKWSYSCHRYLPWKVFKCMNEWTRKKREGEEKQKKNSIVRDNHNLIGRHKGDKLWTNKMSCKKPKKKKQKKQPQQQRQWRRRYHYKLVRFHFMNTKHHIRTINDNVIRKPRKKKIYKNHKIKKN